MPAHSMPLRSAHSRSVAEAAPRFAVYYVPAADDPLLHAGSGWLGRDAETNAKLAQPDLPGIGAITEDARAYGFHATLKPPMRLAAGLDWHALLEAATGLADRLAPFDLPRLAVAELGGFLALCETAPSMPLQALSDQCVAELDGFRAPAGEAELAKRRRDGLTAAQDAMLIRWGYQYVFATWFFHMTLTRRLSAGEQARYRPAAAAHFADALRAPRRVTEICLFSQAAPGVPFTLAARLALRG